jgi:hypothetical protein
MEPTEELKISIKPKKSANWEKLTQPIDLVTNHFRFIR